MMYKFIKLFFSYLKSNLKLVLVLIMGLSVLGSILSNVGLNAAPSDEDYLGRNFGCVIPKTDLKIENLFRPAYFLPVIPDNCAVKDGQAIPLSPILLPLLIGRLFGFLASMIFYLLSFVVIASGIMWTWGGIDNKNISTAKSNFNDAIIGVLLMLGTYVIISTILGVISPNQIDTNLNNIFINRVK